MQSVSLKPSLYLERVQHTIWLLVRHHIVENDISHDTLRKENTLSFGLSSKRLNNIGDLLC